MLVLFDRLSRTCIPRMKHILLIRMPRNNDSGQQIFAFDEYDPNTLARAGEISTKSSTGQKSLIFFSTTFGQYQFRLQVSPLELKDPSKYSANTPFWRIRPEYFSASWPDINQISYWPKIVDSFFHDFRPVPVSVAMLSAWSDMNLHAVLLLKSVYNTNIV